MNKEKLEEKAEEILDGTTELMEYPGCYTSHKAIEAMVELAEYALSQSSGELERLKGEHKEMLEMLRKVSPYLITPIERQIQSLITKIESNGK